MKRALLIIFLIIFSIPFVCSAELEDYAGIDNAWDGQKSITNKEFEQAIDSLQAKQKKKEEKQKKKKIKKISGGGTSLHSGLEPASEIPLQEELTKNEEGLLLNVPVNLIVDKKTLEKGFYNIFGERDKDNNIYLLFYQSQFLKGKIKANETNDDYGEDNIDFVKLIPYNEHYVKIIFGSLDFNAYSYVRYK